MDKIRLTKMAKTGFGFYKSIKKKRECRLASVMADIKTRFNHAVKVIQELPKEGPYQPSNDEKLRFYGLFKQATVGKNNTKRPGMFDFVGKMKWDAWTALGDMTEEEAMQQYVEEYEKMEVKMRELGLVPQ